MLASYLTKWNADNQTQKEVDEELISKLLGSLYRARKAVTEGKVGLVIPLIELGDIDDKGLGTFCTKICESSVYTNAIEALDKGGFVLYFETEMDKKRIVLVIQSKASLRKKEA